jgi:hypothetical protein
MWKILTNCFVTITASMIAYSSAAQSTGEIEKAVQSLVKICSNLELDPTQLRENASKFGWRPPRENEVPELISNVAYVRSVQLYFQANGKEPPAGRMSGQRVRWQGDYDLVSRVAPQPLYYINNNTPSVFAVISPQFEYQVPFFCNVAAIVPAMDTPVNFGLFEADTLEKNLPLLLETSPVFSSFSARDNQETPILHLVYYQEFLIENRDRAIRFFENDASIYTWEFKSFPKRQP